MVFVVYLVRLRLTVTYGRYFFLRCFRRKRRSQTHKKELREEKGKRYNIVIYDDDDGESEETTHTNIQIPPPPQLTSEADCETHSLSISHSLVRRLRQTTDSLFFIHNNEQFFIDNNRQ